MSYTKQNFSDGQTLGASHLNHMEEGIYKNSRKIPTATVADAGKFLRVDTNGKWVAESVQNAEEVAY